MIKVPYHAKLLQVTAALLSIGVSSTLFGKNAGHLATTSFAEVNQLFNNVVKTHSAKKVLIVFDIDNTVMALPTDLGSEHWWIWQNHLIETGDLNKGAVANTKEQLNIVSRGIISISEMELVEPRIASDVDALKKQGVSFMALTSRGADIRDATLRELARNKLYFRDSAPGPKGGYASPYLPYDPQNPEALGLTKEEISKFALNTPRTVVYEDGALLSDGQHKGAMLRVLLAKTRASYDAIIFVDDRPYHHQGVQAAFEHQPEQVYTVHYTYQHAHIDQFNASDKTEVKSQWCQFSQGLRVLSKKPFVFRGCNISQNSKPAAK